MNLTVSLKIKGNGFLTYLLYCQYLTNPIVKPEPSEVCRKKDISIIFEKYSGSTKQFRVISLYIKYSFLFFAIGKRWWIDKDQIIFSPGLPQPDKAVLFHHLVMRVAETVEGKVLLSPI